MAVTIDGSTESYEGGQGVDGADTIGPMPLDPGPCSASGWCWAYPQPTGATLHALWAASPTDVYAAGDAGTLLHYDGTSWRALYAGRIAESWYRIYAIWGSSATDVWAVGGAGSIFHYDGDAWSNRPSPAVELHSIWGTSATHIFAAGAGIVHFDGSSWQPSPTDDDVSQALWAGSFVSEDVAFAVGREGLVARYEGSRWSRVDTPDEMGNLEAVWGSSETNVYAGGTGATLWHFDGTQWASLPRRTNTINALWGRSASEIYIAQADGLFRFDGQAFFPLYENAGAGAETLASDGADGLFAVGQAGRIFQGDGGGLTLVHGSLQSVEAVWARSASEVYIGGYEHVWRLGEGSLQSLFSIQFAVKALCGQEPDVIHALTGAYLHTSRGGAAPIRTTLPHQAEALWCGSSHVFAGGRMALDAQGGALHRFDGAAWETICEGASGYIETLWGASATNVYATLWGTPGVLHYDGAACQQLDSGTSSPTAVWGTSATDVVVLGWPGVISHFDGTVWTQGRIDTTEPLDGLSGRDEILVTGRYGLVYRRMGTAWIEEGTPSSSLRAAWMGDGISVVSSHTGVLIRR